MHSALTLQETISVGLGAGKNVFVAYYDVAKAFDSVWINGLFYQIHQMGVKGKIWRLLYQTYQIFWCKVRVGGLYSDWYHMECGIHQGGFLSLLKYTAFIDPLIRELESSNLGCKVVGIPTSPVGYADDMATSSVSKQRLDSALEVVSEYANRWRYSYNAGKSAIMIYGESKRAFKLGSKNRTFKICGEKVKETVAYDHVGIKNCLFSNYRPRTEERISKGRRAFNAITGVGIKKKGISMKVCSTLFWTIIAPILTYGSEIWVLRGDEVEILRKFQRMVGRKCQRLPPNSPNHGAYMPLGWMSLDRFIQGKKMMFIKTILALEDDAICKRILKERLLEFSQNRNKAKLNEHDSPIFEIFNVCVDLGLYETCMNMIHREHIYSKPQWRKIVWDAVWSKEDGDCNLLYKEVRNVPLMFSKIDKTFYLLWWILSDKVPRMMGICEEMAAIVTESSLLKANDVRLKGCSFWARTCERCDYGTIENARHLIMQCPFFDENRREMYRELEDLQCEEITEALSNPQNTLSLVLGKQPENMSLANMLNLCMITGKHISRMYDTAIQR